MLNIYFIINESDHLTLIVDETIYHAMLEKPHLGLNYIKDLMDTNVIEQQEIRSLSISGDNNEFVAINTEIENTCKESTNQENSSDWQEWNDSATKLLLDKYHTYLADVGPMKKFRLKKNMWEKISADLLNILKIRKSPIQCENRFKTIIKRKKKAVNDNTKTGAAPTTVEYEEELEKIAVLDDSVAPEIKMGVGKCEVRKENAIQKENTSSTNKKKNENPEQKRKKEEKKDIAEILWNIHKEKEEKRERRHREKMELLREIGNKLQGRTGDMSH